MRRAALAVSCCACRPRPARAAPADDWRRLQGRERRRRCRDRGLHAHHQGRARPRATISPSPTTTARSRTGRRTTSTTRSPTTTTRSASIRNTRKRVQQSRQDLEGQGRPRPRHRGLQRGDPLDPKFALAYANRGDVWDDKGDQQPRHRGSRPGDPARSEKCRAPTTCAAWSGRRRAISTARSRTSPRRSAYDPKSAIAYANRGDAWDDKGDQDRAIADLTEALRINPNYARAYNIRGVINRNRNDSIARSRTTPMRSAPIRSSRSPTSTAAMSTGPGRSGSRHRGLFARRIRINPKSDVAYMRRSEAWLKKGDRLAALRDADEAVNLDPNDAANYATARRRDARAQPQRRRDRGPAQGADAQPERRAQEADRERAAGAGRGAADDPVKVLRR